MSFPSPLAKPRGIGDSSPLLIFLLWGAFNIVVGTSLFSRYPIVVGLNVDCQVSAAGVILLGSIYHAISASYAHRSSLNVLLGEVGCRRSRK